MGWARRILQFSATARSLRDIYRYARRDFASAATALSFPFALLAILCGAAFPPFGGVVPVYAEVQLPAYLFFCASVLVFIFLRRKRVDLGPIALYIFANLFFVHFFCGWLAWALDFTSPAVYRTPLRGKQELGGYSLDLRPFSSRQIPLFRVHCLARVTPYPFEAERGRTVELDVWGSLCNELPESGRGYVYVEEGKGVLGTGWRSLSGEEPRSVERGAKLFDHEVWRAEYDARLARENALREAETKRRDAESVRKLEERLGDKVLHTVVLATAPSNEAARAAAEKLSQCTKRRLEIVQNIYPAAFLVIRRLRSKKDAEDWAKKAKACSNEAEVRSLFLPGAKGP